MIALLIVTILSITINNKLVERYYTFEKKRDITDIGIELTKNKDTVLDIIDSLEYEHDIKIILVDIDDDYNSINEMLKSGLLNKGIAFENFWLWEEDFNDAMENSNKIRIYRDKSFGYSILANYVIINDQIAMLVMAIPDMEETITIINFVNACVFAVAAITLFLIIILLIRNITIPLKTIEKATKYIGTQNYKNIEINTNDELQELAQSINMMSRKLNENQELLQNQNLRMQRLLSSASHELKTPISIIKAYSNGIKDSIDDGTFLDTIIQQNNKMQIITESLLDLLRISSTNKQIENLNLSDLVHNEIKTIKLSEIALQTNLSQSITDDLYIAGNIQDYSSIFSNLIINAMKYSSDKNIFLKLEQVKSTYVFEISNKILNASHINIDRLWEPFYVVEESRNKEISGTGFGLSIVKELSQKYDLGYSCHIKENIITFRIIFIL